MLNSLYRSISKGVSVVIHALVINYYYHAHNCSCCHHDGNITESHFTYMYVYLSIFRIMAWQPQMLI